MSFIPYSRQEIDQDDVDAVVAALRSEFLTQGPTVPQFEGLFADRHGVPHAVAVANATVALHLACSAFEIGPQSLVWTSPISFIASANCARYCGADVDFVDIDPTTRNMSLEALAAKLEAAAKEGRLPDLVIPVDFAGLSCDLREMRSLADRYGFRILEDASHATGASYLSQPVGSLWADASVFSFHAVKIVTTAEGGMVTTRDPELAKKLRLLRSHGMTRDSTQLERPSDGPWYYEQLALGFNYRLTELQAALGVSQMRRLPEMHERRTAAADRYDRLLSQAAVILPPRLPDRVSAWHLYAIEVDHERTSMSRRELFETLRRADIGVNVHYIPIHTQPYYQRLGFKRGDFPMAERYYARAISIPLFPAISVEQQETVANIICETLNA